MATTIVLNPVAGALRAVATTNQRLARLGASTVGLLSNNKPNADVLLERCGELLQGRFKAATKAYNKGVPSLEAPPDLLDRIASECQAVILAVDD